MKPLAEIVAEIEADKRAGYPLEIPKADLLRLCAAFRAAEKMRNSCYGDNSGGEYRPKCSDCEADMYEKHSDTCSFKEWDRVTGGADQSALKPGDMVKHDGHGTVSVLKTLHPVYGFYKRPTWETVEGYFWWPENLVKIEPRNQSDLIGTGGDTA